MLATVELEWNLKQRLTVFLLQLLVIIVFLLCEVFLPPQNSLLAIPYKVLLQRLLPELYTDETQVSVHPYFASGLLFVSVTTLVLFFASGMYSEKIAYANKYVCQSGHWIHTFNLQDHCTDMSLMLTGHYVHSTCTSTSGNHHYARNSIGTLFPSFSPDQMNPQHRQRRGRRPDHRLRRGKGLDRRQQHDP